MHDLLSRALRDAGMEVIYTGCTRRPSRSSRRRFRKTRTRPRPSPLLFLVRLGLWTVFRQSPNHPDWPSLTTARPHPIPARLWSEERLSGVSEANPKDAEGAPDGRDGD